MAGYKVIGLGGNVVKCILQALPVAGRLDLF